MFFSSKSTNEKNIEEIKDNHIKKTFSDYRYKFNQKGPIRINDNFFEIYHDDYLEFNYRVDYSKTSHYHLLILILETLREETYIKTGNDDRFKQDKSENVYIDTVYDKLYTIPKENKVQSLLFYYKDNTELQPIQLDWFYDYVNEFRNIYMKIYVPNPSKLKEIVFSDINIDNDEKTDYNFIQLLQDYLNRNLFLNYSIIHKNSNKEKNTDISIYNHDMYYWNNKYYEKKIDIDDIVLFSNIKYTLFSNIKDYFSNNNNNTNNNYSILFQGIQTSGKSTIIKLIASLYNKSIYKYDFNTLINNKNLNSFIECCDGNIIMIENIDKMVYYNTNVIEQYMRVLTYEYFKYPTLICLTSTNNEIIEKINPSLIKPTILNRTIYLDFPTNDMIYELFEKYYKKEFYDNGNENGNENINIDINEEKFYNSLIQFGEKIKDRNVTLSILRQFFINYPRFRDMISNMNELYKNIEFIEHLNK